jgi:putative membrane protein (TIGR04086 family)
MDREKFDEKNKYKKFLIAAVILVTTTFLFIFLFAIIMYLIEGGYEFSPLFATISLGLGSLFSSMYLAKKVGKRGLLIGAIVGMAVFLLMLIISFIANKSQMSVNTLFRFIIITLSSLIGGVIGVNKGNNQKYI